MVQAAGQDGGIDIDLAVAVALAGRDIAGADGEEVCLDRPGCCLRGFLLFPLLILLNGAAQAVAGLFKSLKC